MVAMRTAYCLYLVQKIWHFSTDLAVKYARYGSKCWKMVGNCGFWCGFGVVVFFVGLLLEGFKRFGLQLPSMVRDSSLILNFLKKIDKNFKNPFLKCLKKLWFSGNLKICKICILVPRMLTKWWSWTCEGVDMWGHLGSLLEGKCPLLRMLFFVVCR